MTLSQKETDQIVRFVKKEPKTIQEISKLINKSWVTTDAYVQKIKESTGLISLRIFRPGTQGALKVVYYNFAESMSGDSVKEGLFEQIKASREKNDFDFFEVFQFVPDDKKRVFYEEFEEKNISTNQHLVPLHRQAQRTIYSFSGNLSFINVIEDGVKMTAVFEELLKKKIMIKIICRVTIASMNNLAKIMPLLKKYPEYIEIRHCFTPLRGFIIDDSIARFKNDESLKLYKAGELPKNMRIFYEVFDKEWISWMQQVFWNLFRPSLDYDQRLKQLKRFF